MEGFEALSALLTELSGVEAIKPEDHLRNSLALDSLQMVTLLIELEERFGITLNESDMNPFELNTVDDVVQLLMKYKGESKDEG